MLNYKKIPIEELKTWFDGLVEFKSAPLHHQYVSMAFALGEKLNKVYFQHGIGTGKTRTALYLTQCYNTRGKILVVCPNSVIVKTWVKEIAENTDFTYTTLTGDREERFRSLSQKVNISIINYEGLKVIAADRDAGKGYTPNLERVKQQCFEQIIIDECHKVSNPDSLQTRILRMYCSRARYVIMLSGTPLARSVTDLFGQMLMLDNGAAFGDNFDQFINFYFYKNEMVDFLFPKRECPICGELYKDKLLHIKQHGMKLKQFLMKYPKERESPELIMEAVAPYVLQYTSEECIDLPEAVYQVREVNPTEAQHQAEMEIISGMPVEELRGEKLKFSAQKLFQISGGFLLHDEGPTRFKSNPKLAELESVLNEIDGKVIVYHWYTEEFNIISEMLRKKKIGYAAINSSVTGDLRDDALTKFERDEGTRVLLAQPRTGGEGLNLQFCHIIVYYSRSYMGVILRDQTEGRTRRRGQTQTCVYIDLVMKDTLDEAIYYSLKSNTDEIKTTLEFFKRYREV